MNEINVWLKCDNCNGTGIIENNILIPCPFCSGTGQTGELDEVKKRALEFDRLRNQYMPVLQRPAINLDGERVINLDDE